MVWTNWKCDPPSPYLAYKNGLWKCAVDPAAKNLSCSNGQVPGIDETSKAFVCVDAPANQDCDSSTQFATGDGCVDVP